ncbi:PREDICTED: MIT domain-containing protein 1-like [Priapulus caudatus]|uniref:MIT domain-containing protein 1-like n=1 Tax=Priapulus caudatus TaxID=37621 RepID=A0ABM1DVS3_PRICU|nr:PREDICTED: MIT domain-containing protein 1-like [Priapulus caudatus]
MSAKTEAAGQVLTRAVKYDNEEKYAESLICYQEGIQLLLDALRSITGDGKRQKLRQKISEYMDRAEVIKQRVEQLKAAGSYHEQIHIENNSTGHSYERLFARFLDDDVGVVEVEDPYVRTPNQIYNLLRFCELAVKRCPNLGKVSLITGQESDRDTYQQHQRLEELAHSLGERGVKLAVQYSATLHDREIRVDNGWIIQIGRGLDIYKPTESKFAIGYCDYDLRKCHETTVDIFHKKNVKNGK